LSSAPSGSSSSRTLGLPASARAERLVHQQHFGIQHVSARDRDALLHATGELGRPALGGV
jgi:hypothetical protein